MKNIIIRFFCSKILGHKVDFGYSDNGYLVCKRCNMHEYYDGEYFNSFALFMLPKRIKLWVFFTYQKYRERNSNQLPF